MKEGAKVQGNEQAVVIIVIYSWNFNYSLKREKKTPTTYQLKYLCSWLLLFCNEIAVYKWYKLLFRWCPGGVQWTVGRLFRISLENLLEQRSRYSAKTCSCSLQQTNFSSLNNNRPVGQGGVLTFMSGVYMLLHTEPGLRSCRCLTCHLER